MNEQNMNEQNKNDVNNANENAQAAAENKSEQVKAAVRAAFGSSAVSGTLSLESPIRARSTDVTELKYDFSKVTGWEYAEAMDRDRNNTNLFRISHKQALCLFATAAAKETENVDANDIIERIGMVDAVNAVQLATVFLVTSKRAEKKNT